MNNHNEIFCGRLAGCLRFFDKMAMIYVLKLEPFTSLKTRGHEIVQIRSFCFGISEGPNVIRKLAQLNRVQRQRYNEILRFLLVLKCNHKNADYFREPACII